MPDRERRSTSPEFRISVPIPGRGTVYDLPAHLEPAPEWVLRAQVAYFECRLEDPAELPVFERQAAIELGQHILRGRPPEKVTHPGQPGEFYRWSGAYLREEPGPWLARDLWLARVQGLRDAAALARTAFLGTLADAIESEAKIHERAIEDWTAQWRGIEKGETR